MFEARQYTTSEIWQIASELKNRCDHIGQHKLISLLETEFCNTKEFLNKEQTQQLCSLIGNVYILFSRGTDGLKWFCKWLEYPHNEIFTLLTQKRLGEAFCHAYEAKQLHPKNDDINTLYERVSLEIFVYHVNESQFHECNRLFQEYCTKEMVMLAVKFSSMKNYCLSNQYIRHLMNGNKKIVVYLPKVFNGKKVKQKTLIINKVNTNYLAEIPKAILVAQTDIILVENKSLALNESFFEADMSRVILDSAFRKVIKHYFYLKQEGLVSLEGVRHLTEPQAAYIGGPYSANFYHWMIEYLPSIYLLDQHEEYRDVPIMVDEASIKHPNMRAALETVCGSHKIISLQAGYGYSMDKLIVPSKLSYVSPSVKDNLRPTDTFIKEEAITFLRSKFYTSSKVVNRCLFLARKSNVFSRMTNQEEISIIFAEYGFELVFPEDLTLVDNIKLFSEAKIIAGSTGAAMTNIIFAPENAKIVVFLNEHTVKSTIFSNIAGIIGQDMIYIAGKSDNNIALSYHSSFYINPSDVRNCLNKILVSR